MSDSGKFLSQLSVKEGWKSRSKRWAVGKRGGNTAGLAEMEGVMNNTYGGGDNGGGGGNGGFVMRKRVMVVVDETSDSKNAMMWALTHVTNKDDLLTLLHIVHPSHSFSSSPYLPTSLCSLCKACKPEVEVEALIIQGPKLATIKSQVKKLEVSILVLGQKKASSFFNCMCVRDKKEEFMEQCINTMDCLTIGVKKQSQGMGGYLISTRWQKNFWLLA